MTTININRTLFPPAKFIPKKVVAKHALRSYTPPPPQQTLVGQILGQNTIPEENISIVLRSFEGEVFGMIEVAE